MGSDPHTCTTCGGWNGGGDSHECPGAPSDHLADHDNEISDLQDRVSILEAAWAANSLSPESANELHRLADYLKTDVFGALRYAIHRGLQTFTGSTSYVEAQIEKAAYGHKE